MSTEFENLAATLMGLRPVVPAKDFQIGKRFYVDLGFRPETDDLVEIHLGAYSFILQRYYVQQWAKNFVIHIRVSDVHAWWDHLVSLDLTARYGVKTLPPKQEDWGLVAGVIDPSGVLWRIGQSPVSNSGGKTRRGCPLFGAPDIEDVQHRTIGCSGPSAPGDRFGQQVFELAKVVNLGADVVEMMRSNPANFAA